MKKILNLFVLYLGIFSLYSLISISLFHSNLFSFQNVLFYRGLMILMTDTFITLIIMGVIYFSFGKKNLETIIAALIISLAIHLTIFVVLPVTFERSVTMYLLNTLKTNRNNVCDGLTKEQMKQKLINEYIIKKDAVNKRINEQTIIDMITKKNDCFQLTTRGLNFLKLSEIFKKIYNIK